MPPWRLIVRGSLVGALGGVAAGLADALRAAPELGWWRMASLTCPLYAAAGAALVAAFLALLVAIARGSDDLWAAAFEARESEGARWPAYLFAASGVSVGLFAILARFAFQALRVFHHKLLIAALVAAVAIALLAGGALVVLPIARLLSRVLPFGRRLRVQFRAAAGVEAAAWTAGLLGGAALVVPLLVHLQIRPRLSLPLRAELIAIASLVAGGGGALLFHLVARRLGPKGGFLATPRGSVVAIVTVLAAGVGVAVAGNFGLVVQLDLRPALPLAMFALVLVVGAWLVPRAPGGIAGLLFALLLPLLCLGLALVVGRDARVRKVAVASSGVSGRVIAFVQRASDLDRDGHSAVFGGGDCAEGDPDVHVDAFDEPDDGVDQNCNGHQATTQPPAPGPFAEVPASVPAELNVLLITVDALRADHVGAYGYGRPTTPRLDAFAAKGVIFLDAWAHAPSTRYSVPAILTGRYPSAIATSEKLHWPPAVLPENRLLSEILKERGLTTALLASYGGSGYFQKGWGMFQGFDQVDVSLQKLHSLAGDPANTRGTSSRELADLTIAWLGAHKDQHFFLWTHFYDPHFGFERHPELPESAFGDGELDLYDGEIRFTDHHLGRVFDALDQLGLSGNTLVVITADHGDGFGEHGIPPNQRHGYHLYENETKVPLVLYVPGLGPAKVRSPVGHVDIAPTILNLLRAPSPEPTFLGASRLGLVTGTTADDLSTQVFQEVTYEGPGSPLRGTQKRAIVTHDWHYVKNVVPEATAELYSRREPADRAPDVAGQGLPEEETLAAALAAWMDQLAIWERRTPPSPRR
jgi:arylsulfatase A-like enzyme